MKRMAHDSRPDPKPHSTWYAQLQGWGTLCENEPMSRHTTLGVGGAARWYFRPTDRDAVMHAMQCIPSDLPLLPLGRGSNLIVSDDGFSGLVIDLSCLSEISREGKCVTAEAGVRMNKLSQQCANCGLTGLEFMATIPGDVGGGIAMNAGAFGQQVSDVLQWIEVMAIHGQSSQLPIESLDMAYRSTRLPKGSLVLSACFELQSGEPEAIKERMREMRKKRSSTQPLEKPNCGSVFKNPPNDHAARLIEAAGLKGFRVGGACISEKHANFIINEGQASSHDVRELIRHARQTVEQRFGIRLEPEVRALGDKL